MRACRRVTCTGLIPACAGKTPCSGRRARPWTAHPRVCGENLIRIVKSALVDGSSPRVRGKRLESVAVWRCPRLIPACAGKTTSPRPASRRSPAHPRVCGENMT